MSRRKISNRKINTRDLRERILIVCEGEKTEPNYFKAFQIDDNKCYVKAMGEGYNTISLVERAKKIRDTSLPPFDIVWCVFDKDSFCAEDFNKAIKEATKSGMDVAYTHDLEG